MLFHLRIGKSWPSVKLFSVSTNNSNFGASLISSFIYIYTHTHVHIHRNIHIYVTLSSYGPGLIPWFGRLASLCLHGLHEGQIDWRLQIACSLYICLYTVCQPCDRLAASSEFPVCRPVIAGILTPLTLASPGLLTVKVFFKQIHFHGQYKSKSVNYTIDLSFNVLQSIFIHL